MLHAAERIGRRALRAAHAVARFEQRLVERLAIVSHQHVELRQVFGQPPQQRGFVAVIAHEELAQPEAGGLDGADADQESAGAGAAGQAGSLGIEEGPPRGGALWNRAARKRIEQIGGQFGKVRNVHAAVAAMALPKLFGFEMLAMRRAHQFARDQLLDGAAFRRRCARRAAGGATAYLRSMRATRRRRAASCCWRSSTLRLFFAQYSRSRRGFQVPPRLGRTFTMHAGARGAISPAWPI